MSDTQNSTAVENSDDQAMPIPEDTKPRRKKGTDVDVNTQPLVRSKCAACHSPIQVGDVECVHCGSTALYEPTIDSVSFGDLFASAKSGDEFEYLGPYRNGRDLDALKRHGQESIFSHGGIVAAAVRAGFIVLAHSPKVIFQKP
jgi:hypothetical protein